MRRSAWLVLCACALVLSWQATAVRAICRVVEPVDGPGVAFDATTEALWVISPEQLVDYACESGVEPVWPEPAAPEAEGDPDAGPPPSGETTPRDPWRRRGLLDKLEERASRDGGVPDAGGRDPNEPYCPDDSALVPELGTLVSLVVQPRVAGGGGSAGLVMPVPARPDVHVAPSELFASVVETVAQQSLPEVTEYVQDPSFGWQCYDPHAYSAAEPRRRQAGPRARGMLASALVLASQTTACGAGDESGYYRPGTDGRSTRTEVLDGGTIDYETFPEIEGLEITVLRASSLDALAEWLDAHGFAHDEVDDAAFGRYVADEAWFVAVAIDADGGSGLRALQPIAVTFPSEEAPVTHELQYSPAGGLIVTDAMVLAPSRMQVEDDSDETEWAVPVDANGPLAGFGLSSGWVTRLQIRREMSQRLPDSRLVAAANQRVDPQGAVRVTRVRIPVACTAENGFDESGCGAQSPSSSREYRVTRRPGPPGAGTSDGWETPGAPACQPDYGVGEYGCVVAGAGVPAGLSGLSLSLVLYSVLRRRRRGGRR